MAVRQRCASTARADPACGRGGGEEQRDEKAVHRGARGGAQAGAARRRRPRCTASSREPLWNPVCLHSGTSRCTSSSPLAMARAAEFRAIEEALMGALKFFDTRPSAQDTQRFVALCGEAAATAAATRFGRTCWVLQRVANPQLVKKKPPTPNLTLIPTPIQISTPNSSTNPNPHAQPQRAPAPTRRARSLKPRARPKEQR